MEHTDSQEDKGEGNPNAKAANRLCQQLENCKEAK